MAGFTIKRILRVPCDQLWTCLSDFTGCGAADFEVIIEYPGDPANHQAGAVRRIVMGGEQLREKLVRLDPERKSLTYRLLSGAPVRNYRGTVHLEPFGELSLVTWRVRFHPVFPWPAALVGGYARRLINVMLDEIERALSRRVERIG